MFKALSSFVLSKNTTLNRQRVVLFVILGVCAVLYVLYFSDTTSPLYDCSFSKDSSFYLLLGKAVCAGKLPYVDIWEQKGPAIFYIEAIGYWLTETKLGVWLLQVVFLWATLYLLYKIYRFELSVVVSFSLVFFSCLSLAINYQSGNLIEEYTLPLLGLSTYCLYKWTLYPKRDEAPWHNPKYAFLYGVVLGFSLMTRLTDALGICGAAMVVGVYLIIHRQWKNLLHNMFFYFLGFVVVVLPFIVYFYIHNALYEMWYGTLIFNITYTVESTLGGINDISSFKGFLVAFLNSYGLFFFSLMVFVLNRKRRLAATMWMFMGGFLFVWYIKSNGYGHYGMLALFSTCIIVNELHQIIREKGRVEQMMIKIAGGLYIICILFFGLWAFISQYGKLNDRYAEYDLINVLMSDVPESDKDSFVAFSDDASVYLIGNVLPCYRHSCFQESLMIMDEEYCNIVYDEFLSLRAKWILIKNNSNIHEPKISPILVQYYNPAIENGSYILYKRKFLR